MLHPVICEIVTADGISGIGEAAIAYGLGGTAAAGMIKDLSERLIIVCDPFRIEQAWSRMYDHSFWAKGGGGIVFAAISAIEQALWDIKGKALAVPVYEMLGGRMPDDLRVYANGWYGAARTPAELARAAERPLRDGYTALKCYPLAVPHDGGLRHVTHRAVDREFADLAFAKIAALRQAVGPKVELMLDLSGGLTSDETIRLCRRFEELDILFIEEPADPFDVGALRKIGEHVAIPIAVGERIYTRHGFRKVLEPHAAVQLSFDSPPQIRAGLNVVRTALLSTVYYAVKAVVDPTILPNAGLARPLRIEARPRTLLNCGPPAAVYGRITTCQRVVDLIYGALWQAIPERVVAASNGACCSATFVGLKPDGSSWVYLETIGGGSGARAHKDGLDGVHVHLTNTSNLPVEALELEYPLTLLRYELVDGSGGPGQYRGGMGLRRVYRAEADCRVRLIGSRLLTAPWGLAGAHPGGIASFRLSEGAAPLERGAGDLKKGDIVEIVTAGAGGYGRPELRAASAIGRDVIEGRISPQLARTVYGR